MKTGKQHREKNICDKQKTNRDSQLFPRHKNKYNKC